MVKGLNKTSTLFSFPELTLRIKKGSIRMEELCLKVSHKKWIKIGVTGGIRENLLPNPL